MDLAGVEPPEASSAAASAALRSAMVWRFAASRELLAALAAVSCAQVRNSARPR